MTAQSPTDRERATIQRWRAGSRGPMPRNAQTIVVHFNPASLVYEYTNTLKEEGTGRQRSQYATQTSAKLTVDLVFDTTATGVPVTEVTKKILLLAKPQPNGRTGAQARQVPPVIEFAWGMFVFVGVIETYKETIDFFSYNGVPLRATLNLKMSEKERTTGNTAARLGRASLASDRADVVEVPSNPPRSGPNTAAPGGGGNTSVTDTASALGAPQAARDIAAANGEESIRFPQSPTIAIPTTPQLSGPAAFASAGAGASAGFGGSAGAGFGASAGVSFGASGGAGFDASAGAGFGASAGASFGASAGASFGAGAGGGFSASAGAAFDGSAGASLAGGASLGFDASAGASFGASAGFSASAAGAFASAGISSTEVAFSGLRTGAEASYSFDVSRVETVVDTASVSITAGASFELGGKVLGAGTPSLSAEVGANASLNGGLFASASGKIRFED